MRFSSRSRAGRMIHNNEVPIGNCSDGMTAVGRHDGSNAGARNVRCSVDCDFNPTLKDFVHLFLGVGVFVNRGTGCEVIMRERHAGRMKIAPLPPGKSFYDLQFVRVNTGHEKRRSFLAPSSLS